MDKAGKALRRSGVRLKNISSGHSDLHMVISDLTEIRSTFKTFISAQVTSWEDLTKWSQKERNSIIQETLIHFFELNTLWAEVQRQFVANLKKFKHMFEIILEGEQHIDKSRSHLVTCEQKEAKIRKDIKKTTNKGTVHDIRALEEKLNEAKEQIKAAHMEVNKKVTEQEAVKLIMLKEGLINLSDYYLAMAGKALIIFDAQKAVAEGIPDIKDKEIHDIKYTGSESAKRIVLNAKEQVYHFKAQPSNVDATAPLSPPPYSNSIHSPPAYSSPSPAYPSAGSAYPSVSPSSYISPVLGYPSSPARIVCTREDHDNSAAGHSSQLSSVPIGFEAASVPPRYDLPPRELYENVDAETPISGYYP